MIYKHKKTRVAEVLVFHSLSSTHHLLRETIKGSALVRGVIHSKYVIEKIQKIVK